MPRRSAVGLPCGGNVNLTVAPCSRKQVPAIRGTTTACGFRPVWRVPVSVFSTSHAKGAGRVPQLRIFLNTTEHFEELSRHLPNHGAASCKNATVAVQIAIPVAQSAAIRRLTWKVGRISNAVQCLRIEFTCPQAGAEPSVNCAPCELMEQTMQPDPIIAEIHPFREEYAARFDYDVGRMFQDIQARQAASVRRYVCLPPRRLSADLQCPENGGAGTSTGNRPTRRSEGQ